MKLTAVILSLLCILAAFAGAERFTVVAPEPSVTLPCEVLSVYDGDTMMVRVTFDMNIRLLDCWAAEIKGEQKPEGLKAKANLEKLASGKTGLVSIPLHPNIGKSTSMSRVLGRVIIDGKDVSEQQVKAGFAGRTKPEELEMLEGEK